MRARLCWVTSCQSRKGGLLKGGHEISKPIYVFKLVGNSSYFSYPLFSTPPFLFLQTSLRFMREDATCCCLESRPQPDPGLSLRHRQHHKEPFLIRTPTMTPILTTILAAMTPALTTTVAATTATTTNTTKKEPFSSLPLSDATLRAMREALRRPTKRREFAKTQK